MNLLFSSKLISFLWWVFAPVLVAKMVLSFGLLFLDSSKRLSVEMGQKKSSYIYTLPKFFSTTLEQKDKPKKVDRRESLGALVLKACYIEKGREFVVVREGSKTVFIDLNDSYKGAKLVEIQSESAVFLKDGEHIKLEIRKEATAQAPKRKLVAAQRQDDRFVAVKRDSIEKYKQNPQNALRDIRIAEIREGKEFAGLKVSFVRRGSLFEKMGLKKGDIIKSVDGNRLKSIMDLLPYYSNLNNTAGLLVGFKRDGEIKEIMYEID